MVQARDVILHFSLKYEGDWNKIYDAIIKKEAVNLEENATNSNEYKGNYITILDENYPNSLKSIYRPPFVLYYKGDISLINDFEHMISVVGSRKNSDYGKEMTEKIVSGLADKYIIVSGLAKGIDSIAHRAAIKNGGKTIAVLGTGIDTCYPSENKDLYNEMAKNHLIISEYPNNVSPNVGSFPSRNRIISALSKATIVAEAYARSGTLITVGLALEQGRDVMCVPYLGNVSSQCNRIIKEGATLVENAQDVLDELSSLK